MKVFLFERSGDLMLVTAIVWASQAARALSPGRYRAAATTSFDFAVRQVLQKLYLEPVNPSLAA